MGLDINCDCGEIHIRTSYTGFGVFRNMIAISYGYTLVSYQAFTSTYDTYPINEMIEEDCPAIDFFTHSDCDGNITPTIARRILDGFNQMEDRLLLFYNTKSQQITIPENGKFFSTLTFLNIYNEWKRALNHSIDKKCTLRFG